MMKGDNFFRGEVEDLLTISYVEEVVWKDDIFDANWTAVGKQSKGRKKGNKKDEDSTLVKNNKKGSKVDSKIGESKPFKGKHGSSSSKNGGSTFKNGDVGSSPSSVGRPSNLKKRTTEANRSIADGSQRTILE